MELAWSCMAFFVFPVFQSSIAAGCGGEEGGFNMNHPTSSLPNGVEGVGWMGGWMGRIRSIRTGVRNRFESVDKAIVDGTALKVCNGLSTMIRPAACSRWFAR
ncbi:uncharacterized protein LY79DRAFT_550313 [Colletotrichum navitas]|uniref:Secreted protein n=1 Tax=Colletotrichum navitas TaxID=681940 RepID=A0AAD8V4G3_9PEZI|nr:uncharacterized protein LY79DRAFT_550313 [Colletotrichum navitas]KAK1593927.1 hypothetical protein LY79DRAFT_550313 [Colletotrichum navitas]